MTLITPIDRPKQQLVIAETSRYIQLAAGIYHRAFQPVDIAFNLKGRASGVFCASNTQTLVRYNPYIFAKHYAYSLANTVPHEAAHYIIYCLHGVNGVQPHGPEWKQLMLQFGVEPRRTNTLDLDGIPVRPQRRYAYSCGCTSHQLTTRRHNRIKTGKARYYCRSCKSELMVTP